MKITRMIIVIAFFLMTGSYCLNKGWKLVALFPFTIAFTLIAIYLYGLYKMLKECDKPVNIEIKESEDMQEEFYKEPIYKSKKILNKEELPQDYTVLDFETTGLISKLDSIIQVAALRYRKFSKVDEFVSFVNPHRRIPLRVTEITGITDKDVEGAPTIDEVLPKLLDFLGEDIIVAHNAEFDIKFLIENLRKYRIQVSTIKYVDTLYLARKYIKGLKNYKLSTLKEYLNIDAKSHLADEDCYVCGEVYKYCFSLIDKLVKN